MTMPTHDPAAAAAEMTRIILAGQASRMLECDDLRASLSVFFVGYLSGSASQPDDVLAAIVRAGVAQIDELTR